MHPVFSSAKNLFVVAGLWMALSMMVSYFMYLIAPVLMSQTLVLFLPLLFVYFFFCLSNYYICMRVLIRKTRFIRLIFTQFVALATTVLLWLLLGFSYAYVLNKDPEGIWLLLYWDSLIQLAIIGAMLYCFWILAHYIYLMAQQHDMMERSDLQRRLLISQVELQVVKAAVHPHFLFNSLTTLAQLALTVPEKVHDLCLQISAFLRYSIDYNRKDSATVEEELEHICNYLAIERERFAGRLDVVFDIDERVRSERMLPLLLFPLVENSIKHGIGSCLQGGTVTLHMHQKAQMLHVLITNPYDELGRKSLGTHLGLESVKKRVYAYYGRAAKVDVTRACGQFSVKLWLPLNEK